MHPAAGDGHGARPRRVSSASAQCPRWRPLTTRAQARDVRRGELLHAAAPGRGISPGVRRPHVLVLPHVLCGVSLIVFITRTMTLSPIAEPSS